MQCFLSTDFGYLYPVRVILIRSTLHAWEQVTLFAEANCPRVDSSARLHAWEQVTLFAEGDALKRLPGLWRGVSGPARGSHWRYHRRAARNRVGMSI